MKSNFQVLTFLATTFLAWVSPVAAQTPPPNDNFAASMVLQGQAVSSMPVDITAATREGLEPSVTGNQSVWYTWTAPQDGLTTFTTAGSTSGFPIICAFNGTVLADLVLIDRSEGDSGNGTRSLTFPVKGGFVYQISIGTDAGNISRSLAVLNINNQPSTITSPTVVGTLADGNDNFADAVTLPGANVSGFTYPLEATREGLEPSFTGDRTVWWKWTSPADAQVTVDTDGTGSSCVLLVFNGDTLPDLTVVGGAIGSPVTFPTKAGTNYYISVGSDGANTAVLNITTAALAITTPVVIESQAAANDNFANAQDLGSSPSVSGFGFNGSATTESQEPQQDGTSTIWWTWTTPQDGTLAYSSAGTTFEHRLFPYTGNSLSTLQGTGYQGSPSQPVTKSIPVTQGTTYHFVIGTIGNTTGTAVLTLNFSPASPEVTVVASTPTLLAGSGTMNAFTLNLAAATTTDIKVAYTVKGSATPGVDYVPLKGTAKIKAGKTSKSIQIDLTGDLGGAAKKTVKLTLTPGEGYTVGTTAPVKVKILAEP